ncbi:hypothetical protein BDN72DRAFT_864286, partial [Pluteus cervinus]
MSSISRPPRTHNPTEKQRLLNADKRTTTPAAHTSTKTTPKASQSKLKFQPPLKAAPKVVVSTESASSSKAGSQVALAGGSQKSKKRVYVIESDAEDGNAEGEGEDGGKVDNGESVGPRKKAKISVEDPDYLETVKKRWTAVV